MFKPDLDQAHNYTSQDRQLVATSIRLQSKQLDQSLAISQATPLNFDPTKVKRIVYAGMGGSVMAGQILKSVMPYFSSLPIEIVSNYRLPVWVDKHTLCILVSYSGQTEEVLSCYQDAIHRTCPSVVISTGGKLIQTALDKHLPFVRLPTETNPSHSPRYGAFSMIGATLGILFKTPTFSYTSLSQISPFLDTVISNLDTHVAVSRNSAKKLAKTFGSTTPLIITANHFEGLGDALLPLFHESLKTLALSMHLPDINHHLFEALSHPRNLNSLYQFLFIESALYPPVIMERIDRSKQTLKKQGFRLAIIKPEGADGLMEALESLVFLSWFSYYLCIINNRPILDTPWVNYFKQKI
jgi:glucose/mannose-6-phosphate isomerase